MRLWWPSGESEDWSKSEPLILSTDVLTDYSVKHKSGHSV